MRKIIWTCKQHISKYYVEMMDHPTFCKFNCAESCYHFNPSKFHPILGLIFDECKFTQFSWGSIKYIRRHLYFHLLFPQNFRKYTLKYTDLYKNTNRGVWNLSPSEYWRWHTAVFVCFINTDSLPCLHKLTKMNNSAKKSFDCIRILTTVGMSGPFQRFFMFSAFFALQETLMVMK